MERITTKTMATVVMKDRILKKMMAPMIGLENLILMKKTMEVNPKHSIMTELKKKAAADKSDKTVKDLTPELTSAAWLGATYISDDSQRLEAAANERWLSKNNEFVEQAKTYDPAGLTPATARALHLLKVSASMPAPRDPANYPPDSWEAHYRDLALNTPDERPYPIP